MRQPPNASRVHDRARMDAHIREDSASAADAHEAALTHGLSHGAGGNVPSQCNMVVLGCGKREKRPSAKALGASASADDAEDSARAVKRKKPQNCGFVALERS